MQAFVSRLGRIARRAANGEKLVRRSFQKQGMHIRGLVRLPLARRACHAATLGCGDCARLVLGMAALATVLAVFLGNRIGRGVLAATQGVGAHAA